MKNHERVNIAVEHIRQQLPENFVPEVAIVLGTGLGTLADLVQNTISIDYADIPYFPHSTVDSHHGCLTFGYLPHPYRYGSDEASPNTAPADVNPLGIPVVLQQGRSHLYEGYQPHDVCMGIRVMATLGAKKLIITNAAGSINPLFDAGSLMLITDHINFTGRSPLVGPNHDDWGPRFPDMSAVYDASLRAIALEEASALGIRLERGIYVGVLGPQLETPAETRMFRNLGIDAIGMSTVHEVIAAKHLGMQILGISSLSNQNLPDCMAEATLEDIIRVAGLCGEQLLRLIPKIVARM
ncbi:MAG: purine-nucleoside phosphorylase [Pseudomonadota bacterium]